MTIMAAMDTIAAARPAYVAGRSGVERVLDLATGIDMPVN